MTEQTLRQKIRLCHREVTPWKRAPIGKKSSLRWNGFNINGEPGLNFEIGMEIGGTWGRKDGGITLAKLGEVASAAYDTDSLYNQSKNLMNILRLREPFVLIHRQAVAL